MELHTSHQSLRCIVNDRERDKDQEKRGRHGTFGYNCSVSWVLHLDIQQILFPLCMSSIDSLRFVIFWSLSSSKPSFYSSFAFFFWLLHPHSTPVLIKGLVFLLSALSTYMGLEDYVPQKEFPGVPVFNYPCKWKTIYLSQEMKQNQIIKHVRSAEKTKSPKNEKHSRYKWRLFQLSFKSVACIKVLYCNFWPCMCWRRTSWMQSNISCSLIWARKNRFGQQPNWDGTYCPGKVRLISFPLSPSYSCYIKCIHAEPSRAPYN